MCNDVKSFVKRGFWAVHHKVTDQVQMAEQEITHRKFLRFGPTFTAELYLSNTTTSDSYYENEPLTISCHSTDIPALGPYVMWMWISSDVHQGVLCTRDKGEWLANDVDFVDGKPVYKKKKKMKSATCKASQYFDCASEHIYDICKVRYSLSPEHRLNTFVD